MKKGIPLRIAAWSAVALVANDALIPYTVDIECKIDPFCHPVSAEFTAPVKAVFSEGIDYSRIYVMNRPSMMSPFSRASAFGNVMFMSPSMAADLHSPDKDTRVDAEGDVVHEFTHFAQIQSQGGKWHIGYDYDYKVTPESKLEDFNREQQAEIARNLYIKTVYLQTFLDMAARSDPAHLSTAFVKKSVALACHDLKVHRNVLIQGYKIEPLKNCP